MKDLGKRSLVAIFGIPLLLFVIYYGGIYFAITLATISTIALWEFYTMVANKGAITEKKWGLMFNLIFWTLLYFSLNSINISKLAIISVLFFLIGSLTIQLFSKNQNAIMNIATTWGGLIYVNLFFSSLFLIREFDSYFGNTLNFNPEFLVFSFILAIWICDTSAYFIGSKFGKNKLLPAVSPKKSWEGAIAGFVGALFTMVIFNLATNNFNLIHSIFLGIIVGIAGQIGDLAESQLKRDAQVKDSSNILPGHGGFLDRFDSIMFVSPLILIYLLILQLI